MTKQDIFTDSDHREPPHYYAQQDDEIDLRELFGALWHGKWIIILTTIIFAAGAVAYALHLPNTYKSDALLAPADNSGNSGLSQMASQFGGLASLAGVNLAKGQTSQADLAVQVLQSRQFIEQFIKEHHLLVPLMVAKGWDLASNKLIYNDEIYDISNKKWLRKPKGLRGIKPSAQEAYEKFSKDVLNVSQNKDSGLYTISVSFYSPYLAQQWVSWLVEDINKVMRDRTIAETTKNLNYLKEQLEKTAVADMQSAFYKLIEEQTKKLMLAEVQDEFVFKTIDPPFIPEEKFKPKRISLVILGSLLGIIFGSLFSLITIKISKSYDEKN
ncbi:Wzz/FepE/Etk N-terminal domain-containing protein [Vibrio salinus]|uniref:Wzz/FepE/Etk N-terminal domain-containing protein n=1 Tax=Vibrio salinus TaxID=2899784 RepID=UPI001E28B05C|nr:Wzz/FepE/Etk N-terminal domain-containing protein [Vibrio salinus]MCE0493808.1 Wzz/FepE/Etk N-terminal domain-containing protein [Vibrio salinus]